MHYLKKEKVVRDSYNKKYNASTKKEKLELGTLRVIHEYDIYEKGRIIAGVSTSPWKNRTGTNNTGGQDRAAAELLWLSLWGGSEDRWHILTERSMANNLFKKFHGVPFRKKVSVYHFNLKTKAFTLIGALGEA